MSRRDELVRLVPPPPLQLRQFDWSMTEARLGTKLPSDYKWLVERYGPGSFDDFLHVFQPGSSIEAIQLEYQAERTARALDYLRDRGEMIPYPTLDLLSFARSDNGDVCYWLRRPVDNPDAWSVVVNEPRGSRWSTFEHGMVEFLLSVLSGTYVVHVFPDDFPSGEPEFQPYPT